LKKVIIYQIFVLVLLIISWFQFPLGNIPTWLVEYELAINCILIATSGGVLYCLRAIYISRCVNKSWDSDWELWYYLRPITSSISGLIAFVFLNAGLIILEADQQAEAGNFGYLAFAFIAGFNVDKFVQKIEDVAKSSFGIEKTRTSKNDQ